MDYGLWTMVYGLKNKGGYHYPPCPHLLINQPN